MKKRLVLVTLLMAFIMIFASTAGAITLDELDDNIMRIGNDFYAFDSANFTEDNILNSLEAGVYIYVKLGGCWYNLSILTDAQIMNSSFATSEEELDTWTNMGTLYGSGNAVEEVQTEVGSTGSYSIADFNQFTKAFAISVEGLDEAAYFNVFNGATALANSPVAIDGQVTNVGAVFSDISTLTVKFYSDAAGENLLATASLNADGSLSITAESDFQVVDIY